MARAALVSVFLLCGCQPQPVLEVSLGSKDFEVKDAVFFSTMNGPWLPTTFVVFGARTGLCQAFEDQRNVCNARVVPDVHDGIIGTLSRPVGVKEPLGWLTLRSATEGSALAVGDVLGLSTPGASLTESDTPVLHSVKNRVVIEHFMAGETATVSFESELNDGRAFQGRVEASWCPALDMVRRHNDNLGQGGGTSSGPDSGGFVTVASCGAEAIEERCSPTADGSETCTCLRGGVTSTCSLTQNPLRPRQSCCNLRFGD